MCVDPLIVRFRFVICSQDFANQYFVMSILGNPKEDGIHWPMILNVPGEGFGDDFLQIYTNQSLLTDDDDYLFLLDEALTAIGGSCPELQGFGDGEGGPPTDIDVHIPSNLEVEPNSWFSNVYTFSPVWEPEPVMDGIAGSTEMTNSTEMAVTTADRVVVKSCFDENEGAVHLSVEYTDIDVVDMIPWMALGYRETEECLMSPRSGADTQIILISQSSPEENAGAFLGALPPAARGMGEEAILSIYQSLVPLSETESFSNVSVHTPASLSSISRTDPSSSTISDSSVVLEFKQTMEKAPEKMNLMYAIGSTSQLGFHATRNCFEIVDFPSCYISPTKVSGSDQDGGEQVELDGSKMQSVVSSGSTAVMNTFLACASIAAFLVRTVTQYY
jgi:hypothetical protein